MSTRQEHFEECAKICEMAAAAERETAKQCGDGARQIALQRAEGHDNSALRIRAAARSE